MSTITNTTLLQGLQATRDGPAWTQFFSRYQPLLVAFGKRLGLAEADAQDAAQETLLAFAESYRRGAYNRGKGRLRSYLFGIATKKVRDIQRRKGRELAIVDPPEKTHLLSRLPDEKNISEVWETEWQRVLMDACMEDICQHVEPTTLEAFELFVMQEIPAGEVAEQLGISRNAVFKAKRRILTRMRRVYQRLQTEW